jgi:hypothetical protein
VGRFLAALTLVGLLVSCQNETHAVFSPVPSPSPHHEPTAAILQPSDVPAGLLVCLGSGPIGGYVQTLASEKAPIAQKVSDGWDELVTAGARSGAISIYTSAPPACSAELGATATIKAAASVVARFDTEGQADRAWQAGVFGFVPPAPGEIAPGVTLGTSTGLGLSSFTFVRSPVRLACWHRSVYVALVVISNLDPASFASATAAVDARLN